MDLEFDRAFEPRHGEAVAVARGVRRVTAHNPGPFTFQGTNSFIIGDAKVAVLDPGPVHSAHLEALLSAIGRARVSAILVSHTHKDHSSAARPLQAATGAPILAAGPHGMGRPPFSDSDRALDAGGDRDFTPDSILRDGEILDVGGFGLETVATPGHAANHLAFALLGQDLLFSGDHVMGWATTSIAPPDGSMADYMASLDKLLARPERRYLPAHGGEIRDAHAWVRSLRTHRRMRERAIRDRLARGDQTISKIVTAIYAGLTPSLAGAAELSTLAHLRDLVGRDIVTADGAPTLGACYWLTSPDVGTGAEPVASGSGPVGCASGAPGIG